MKIAGDRDDQWFRASGIVLLDCRARPVVNMSRS